MPFIPPQYSLYFHQGFNYLFKISRVFTKAIVPLNSQRFWRSQMLPNSEHNPSLMVISGWVEELT
jgi:hypothetical protein